MAPTCTVRDLGRNDGCRVVDGKRLVRQGIRSRDLSESWYRNVYDLAREFAQMIDAKDGFELALEPDANIVCFRLFNPQLSLDENNRINVAVRQAVLEEGEFYIVQTISNKIQ